MKPVNEVLSAIAARRSIRSFRAEQISDDALAAILEAGQTAPYVLPKSRHFCVIQDRDAVADLNAAAKENAKTHGNPTLTKLCENPAFDGTYGAPAVIILSGGESTVQYEFVCAMSAQSMLLAAQSLGIASCCAYFPIFAFHGGEEPRLREKLRIPIGFKPCGAILLGYSAEKPQAGEDERYKNSITYIRP